MAELQKKRRKIWNKMTASILKQDPNIKRFKWMLINFAHFWPFICCLSVILWLNKGDFPEICILCVCIKINKHLFEPFCVWSFLKKMKIHYFCHSIETDMLHFDCLWFLVNFVTSTGVWEHSWGFEKHYTAPQTWLLPPAHLWPDKGVLAGQDMQTSNG